MLRSWRLGKLFGIPVFVHPTFLIIPLMAWMQAPEEGWSSLLVIGLVLAVFGCVLLHEFGHALMARFFGIGTKDITLTPIGGVARLSSTGENPGQELAIAVAGPAVNVFIAALLTPFVFMGFYRGIFAAHPEHPESLPFLGLEFLTGLWIANIVLVVFNMLPAFPMDGGRVLRSLLSMGMPRLRATEIAAKVGMVIAFLIGCGAFYTGNFMLILVALFVVFAGQAELQGLRFREMMNQPVTIMENKDPFSPNSRDQPSSFTGYTWDNHHQIWIQWIDGRPFVVPTSTPNPSEPIR